MEVWRLGAAIKRDVMPDYGEILSFLAKNPPQLEVERELHASLLELLANCLRGNGSAVEGKPSDLTDRTIQNHKRVVHFN